MSTQQPEHFNPLLAQLQSQPHPPLTSILTPLIKAIAESAEHMVLILDDYQIISEIQVHTILPYLIEYLPRQLRIIVATRSDPPLPLPLLWARQKMLEVRTDQLHCTVEETKTFFQEVMEIQLPDETLQQVRTGTKAPPYISFSLKIGRACQRFNRTIRRHCHKNAFFLMLG